jgi:hypothetical protein
MRKDALPMLYQCFTNALPMLEDAYSTLSIVRFENM